MKKRILVVGDGCEDIYIYGKCERLCPDAPVPVLIPTKKIINGGMAKNVYENIKSIYPYVDLITNKNLISKTRFVHERTNQMFVRVDEGEHLAERVNIQDINLNNYELIVLADYCKGFLREEDIEYICANHKNVFLDTKKILGSYCQQARIIKINEVEYNRNVEAKIDLSKFHNSLITTLGDKGCRYENILYGVDVVEIKDMTGAGDTFMACLVVKYLQTDNIETAITFANECATTVVQHKGVVKIGDHFKLGSLLVDFEK
ncbi:MAG: hypothetical protein EBU90_03435 [Proteobacteria bacterium]|nr:hypothetical protein [Pseudomonadota bacterium]NBP13380.1 hypothetical protein [bacterium]